MSGDPKPGPATAEFLAEARRKQAAYAAARRQHYERIERQSRGDPDELDEIEATPASNPAGPPRRHSRGKINDPRQLRFEL